MEKPKKLFFLILIMTLAAILIDLPAAIPLKLSLGPVKINQEFKRPNINLKIGSFKFSRDLDIKQGLDLKGGTHLVFEANMQAIEEADRQDALDSAKEVISRRIDLYGVSEPIIQTAKHENIYRIIVELPGITNTQEAIELIGQTAQLDFREQGETGDQESSAAAEAGFPAFNFRKFVI
jgi:preprotein translocase subunit SecD